MRNEVLRREGQYRGIPQCKKSSIKVGGITDLYVNNDRNESSNMILNPAPDPWMGILQRILGGGVPPGSLNPDPISDQKMSFSTPFCRPGL